MIEKIVGEVGTKDSCCPDLSYKARITGFCICFGIGFICSGGSFFLLVKNPAMFTLFFTIGNICSLLSSFFLVGPKKQWKNMMKATRLAISVILLALIVGTLIVGFALQDTKWNWLKILLCACQFAAMLWYNLSYVPFGRTIVKKCAKNCCCDDETDG